MTKFEKRMEELEIYCKEYDCSEREALMDVLMDFYECAGFQADLLEIEINSMNDEELMKAYLTL